MSLAKKKRKENKIEIRTNDIQKDIIAKAASIEHKSISSFILEIAYEKAREIVAEQVHFYLNEEDFKEFVNNVYAPGKVIPEIQELMRGESPFGKEFHII